MIMRLLFCVFCLSLVGCTAKGNSFFLAEGEPQHFLTLGGCEAEALRKYADGGSVYSGFVCRKMFLGLFQLEVRRYFDGRRTDS
jgi:hypothetical protein